MSRKKKETLPNDFHGSDEETDFTYYEPKKAEPTESYDKPYYYEPALTKRQKKAILEKEIYCRVCKPSRVLAAKVNDEGVPLCRIHG